MAAPDATVVDFDLGVFADFSPPTDEALRWACNSWGASDIVFGFWSDDETRFRPRGWSRNSIVRVVDACAARSVRSHFMVWAARNAVVLPSMLDWLEDAVALCPGVNSVLLDCEGHWHSGKGLLVDDAVRLVVERFKGRRWGVSGLTRLHRTVRPLAELASYVVPQCYSFWHPADGDHWSHSESTTPQYQQVVGVDSWAKANREIIMALACYWGGRPAVAGKTAGLTASQTMRSCAAETSALGIDRVWYWSLKWLRERSPRGEEVREFFGCKL